MAKIILNICVEYESSNSPKLNDAGLEDWITEEDNRIGIEDVLQMALDMDRECGALQVFEETPTKVTVSLNRRQHEKV
jgi:hypothetical protein